jgi:hypothetical protein
VAANVDTADATNGGSTATMSNLQVSAPGVTAAASIDVTAPGLAASNAVLGNIVFDLDISGVTTPDTHTGMQYTITATAP